jgi:hypothetical protein
MNRANSRNSAVGPANDNLKTHGTQVGCHNTERATQDS